MLEMLRVKNYALIDELKITFDDGLNVITGETGAGKSILIGALGLILGDRADKDAVRSGADSCMVEAVFNLLDPALISGILEDAGIEHEEGQTIIRRIVPANGGGKCYINDQPATLQTLRRLGDLLVDMHGAHDHQSLLHTDFQLDIIDDFAGVTAIKDEYSTLYTEFKNVEKELTRIRNNTTDASAEIDMLNFQIQEIESAGISEAEEQDIEQEHKLLANSQRIGEITGSVLDILTENDNSIADRLGTVQKQLDELVGLTGAGAEWENEITAVLEQTRDISRGIASLASSIESDPNRLLWLEERIAVYHTLKHKYGGSTSETLKFLETAGNRLRELSDRDEIISDMLNKLEAIRKKLLAVAAKLSEKRKTTSEKLTKLVVRELRELAFDKAQFKVLFNITEPGPSGTDSIEFMFAANPGEPASDLRAVASSGEMSRIMLALKGVLAESDRVPVLVFDEIDVNIGGTTGSAVGRKLGNLSKNHQILCITHLPQVAVCADSHFGVIKKTVDKRTTTSINRLDDEEKIGEITRMLGGSEISGLTSEHAKEMLGKKTTVLSGNPRRKKDR